MNTKFVSGVDTKLIKKRIEEVGCTKFPELVLFVLFGFQLKFEEFEGVLQRKNQFVAAMWYRSLKHERATHRWYTNILCIRVPVPTNQLPEELIINLSGAMHLIE
jgi:hypothetical protein